MIYLPGIPELELLGVFDRGVANKERIVLRARTAMETTRYGVIIGWYSGVIGTPVQPINDLFYWFGDGSLQAGETVFLYTGVGEPAKTTIEGTNDVAYVIHWNRPTTLLADSRILPIVISIGQLLVAPPPVNTLQLRSLADLAKVGK